MDIFNINDFISLAFGQSPSTAFITKEEEEKTSTTEDTTQNRSNSTGLSFTPLCMTFEDIIYSVDMPKVIN